MLDPEVRKLLDTVLLPRNPPFDAAALRLGHLASTALLGGEAARMHSVDGFAVDASERWGTPQLAVRRYQPRAACSRAIVWLHGGGWVTGTLDGYDTVACALAQASDSQVFAVDYRLAPEAPYPAAIADCTAACEFIVAHADRFGIDVQRLVLAGDSAGGHLAIGAARWLAGASLARDPSMPRPAALVLVYPVTDARMMHGSYGRFADGYHLSAAQMAWFWQQFAPRGLSFRSVSDLGKGARSYRVGPPGKARVLVDILRYRPGCATPHGARSGANPQGGGGQGDLRRCTKGSIPTSIDALRAPCISSLPSTARPLAQVRHAPSGKPVSLEHPDLSPLLADDLPNLPPTLVVTAQCDVLHDEGLAFASALGNAGVEHEYLEIPAMIHGFMRFRAAVRQARELPQQITAQLDRWKI